MTKVTRRGLLKKTSTGAVALGALAVVPHLHEVYAAAPGHMPTAQASHVVAYVHNASKGEVALLVGEREVIVRDHELVRRLLKAAQ